ncbi:MAG: hypothetical protein ACYC6Y_26465 [Thermoguttaceae bacterium]
MLSKSLRAVVVCLVVVAAFSASVLACNTPVYRYAMYNWQTAPYIVFYFHKGAIPEADQALHKSLEKFSEELPPQANVRIEAIDVSDTKKMETLPDFVTDAWKAYEGGKTPAYLVFSPLRAHIYSGQLDAAAAEKLVDSPARQKLGRLLEEGNAAVMILLTCPDAEQNRKAEEALAGLSKAADAGEIPVELELPPMGLPGQAAGDEGAEPGAEAPNKLAIAVLKVDRNDPAEEFFVRMLMAVEDDLKEYADQPMIFAGYGRGRAMEPYIGKGITKDNLVDVVAFLAGACSCMVKEQNPGADLLVKWDWDKTADKMAENDPTLDYGPYGEQGYGEFPAEPGMTQADAEADRAETAAADTSETQTAGSPAVVLAAANETPAAPEPVAQSPNAEAASSGTPTTDQPAAAAQASAPQPATAPEAAGLPSQPPAAVVAETAQAPPFKPAADSAAAEPGSFAGRRMMTYAIGFGAIGLGVLLAGLALVMRRS